LLLILIACQQATDPALEVAENQSGNTQSAVGLPTGESPTSTVSQTSTLLPLATNTPMETIIASDTVTQPSQTPTSIPTTTLLFTGVIVPARCVQAGIDAAGDNDYLYDEVREIITRADLAVGTLNATISDFPPHTGCVPTYVLVGSSQNADAMQRAGFDVMSVATNHIKNCGITNCGDRAFFDTLENLQRVGISPVGAGDNLAHAMEPLVVELNGVRFGFVSLGQLEPLTFATEDQPGIAVLTEQNLTSAIQAARELADVVIVLPHWGPEDVPLPNWSQRGLAQVAVAAGADLVVGNHTHVIQAIEEIDGVTVFYGLGNFVFDQNWARDHQQGVMLLVTFQGTKMIDYQLIPTYVDLDGRVHLAEQTEAAEILARIERVSKSLP
jgi:poly-gamma-glutamate synthesis protein (capsule biosynthesis protein)